MQRAVKLSICGRYWLGPTAPPPPQDLAPTARTCRPEIAQATNPSHTAETKVVEPAETTSIPIPRSMAQTS